MVVCWHCDSFPRTGTHVQIQEKAARARARTRVRAARPLCQVGPTLPPMQCRGRCSPPDALDAQRVVLRHAPAQWPPLDACARRWQRRRAPRRCPLHALALSPRTQPSGESFCTGLCSLDGRHCGTWWHVGDTLATAGAGARLALRGGERGAARRGVAWRGSGKSVTVVSCGLVGAAVGCVARVVRGPCLAPGTLSLSCARLVCVGRVPRF